MGWAAAAVCLVALVGAGTWPEAYGRLRYVSGDALLDPSTPGPDGKPYPVDEVNRLISEGNLAPQNMRRGRTLHSTLDPETTRARLLSSHQGLRNPRTPQAMAPEGRSLSDTSSQNNLFSVANVKTTSNPDQNKENPSSVGEGSGQCAPGPPARLCPTSYNTTAPMYGISLTSGQPVTIVQKFPDLLQQVIFEMCETDKCDVLQGQCVQTYVPYLFLVIPLGPVTLTGQDYVLVESGCVCQPKYSQGPIPSPVDAIPSSP